MPRLPIATAFGELDMVEVHPAPDANYWGEGQSNCHSITVTSADPVVWDANAEATLVLIDASEAVRCLVDGSASVSGGGFPIRAGQQVSFGIPAGASIAFQAVADDATVTVLEA